MREALNLIAISKQRLAFSMSSILAIVWENELKHLVPNYIYNDKVDS